MEYRAAKLGRASPVRSTSRSDLTYRQATDVSAVGDDLAHQHDRRRENLRLAQGRVARRGRVTADPRPDRGGHSFGLLGMGGVSGICDGGEQCVRKCGCHPLPDPHELGIVFPSEQQHRYVDLSESMPQRFLVAGARETQAAGEPRA